MAVKVKEKLLTARINDDLERAIITRCSTLGCNRSDYIKSLIQSDLDDSDSQGKPASRSEPSEVEMAIPIGRIHRAGDSKNVVKDGNREIAKGEVLTRVARVNPATGLVGYDHYGKDGKLSYFEKATKPGEIPSFTLYE